jgi:predicted RNase H-like HicB family nuclease
VSPEGAQRSGAAGIGRLDDDHRSRDRNDGTPHRALGSWKREAASTIQAQYLCTFLPNPEGGYSVRCAAFPELITNGRTLEDARASAREALELCVAVYEDEGRPLPPSDVEPHKTIKELVPVKLARA